MRSLNKQLSLAAAVAIEESNKKGKKNAKSKNRKNSNRRKK